MLPPQWVVRHLHAAHRRPLLPNMDPHTPYYPIPTVVFRSPSLPETAWRPFFLGKEKEEGKKRTERTLKKQSILKHSVGTNTLVLNQPLL